MTKRGKLNQFINDTKKKRNSHAFNHFLGVSFWSNTIKTTDTQSKHSPAITGFITSNLFKVLFSCYRSVFKNLILCSTSLSLSDPISFLIINSQFSLSHCTLTFPQRCLHSLSFVLLLNQWLSSHEPSCVRPGTESNLRKRSPRRRRSRKWWNLRRRATSQPRLMTHLQRHPPRSVRRWRRQTLRKW